MPPPEKQDLSQANLNESLIKSLPGLFVLFDTKGNIHWWNEKLEQYSGYSGEKIKRMHILELVDEQNKEAVQKKMEETLEKGEADIELQLKDHDGNTMLFLLTGVSVILNGEDFIIATGLDITSREQDRLEKIIHEKNILLGEVHHRVKNNLAVVSGLLSMQADKAQNDYIKELFNESESRIKAISMIHQLLYEQENFSELHFGPYVKELTDSIASIYQDRKPDIEVHVDENVYLDIKTGIPCALIIHELTSNAIKHGCKDQKDCEIRISMTREQDENSLMVSDNGTGLPSSFQLEKATGLGLSLVQGLTAQIGGTLDIHQNNGTAFLIKFSA
ncbi:MAG: histidine kinase dimerization/phosphoacceptor domain -containing protein [Balneolales bacterium]